MNSYGRGTTFGMKDRNKKRKLPKLMRWILYVVIAGILWIVYALAQIGSVERSSAVILNNSEPYDVGIVLGASLWNDVPSPGLKERLDLAFKDYKEGKFRYFILTGGLDQPDFKNTEAQGMRNYLEERGVLTEDMLLENEATSTYENLKFSKVIMEDKSFKTALIITHTFHGNRALEIAENLDYSNPKLSITKSKVLNSAYYTSREVLAYTKWKITQLAIVTGLKT